MNRVLLRFGFIFPAVGLLFSSTAFSAQDQLEEVIIKAERPTVKMIGRGNLGQPIDLIELSYHVQYADLDLATSAGADTLRKRVHEAAVEACQDLDKMYPLSEPDQNCSKDAEDRAMTQVDEVIKTAKMH